MFQAGILDLAPILVRAGLASAVENALSLFLANFSGVRVLWGRSVLYLLRQPSMIRRACAILMNQRPLKHSSRNMPSRNYRYFRWPF